jgi:hypothetical protein
MELDNDNIIISNIANYNISFYNGNMILKKIPKKINVDDIKKYDLKKSKII